MCTYCLNSYHPGCAGLCTYCLNSYHPGCAGLCPTIRRLKDDWACPECVWEAEKVLQLDPLHLSPMQAMKAATARLPSASTDSVESEAPGATVKEPSNKASLAWMRWRMAKECDFKNEMNMLQKLISGRNHLCQFLPKFHCDLNWTENFWGKSKPYVRKLIDGAWMTMCQAIWLSYGHENISEGLSMRFARKIRETIMMYFHGVDGAFAAYCQKRFNMHRLPFYDASSLAKWEVGSPATTTLSTEGKQMHFCRLTDLNADAGTCSVKFNGGVVRDGVLLTDLRATPDNSVCLR